MRESAGWLQVQFARLVVRGVAELDQFENQQQRSSAIRALADRYAVSTFKTAYTIGIVILPWFVMPFVIDPIEQILATWLKVPRRVAFYLVPMAFVLVIWSVPLAYMRLLARRQLRDLLIARGIPVCRGCGYSLRGQTPESKACPECGRAIDEDVSRMLIATGRPVRMTEREADA